MDKLDELLELKDQMATVASVFVDTQKLNDTGKLIVANWLRRKALQLESGENLPTVSGSFLADKRDKVFFENA